MQVGLVGPDLKIKVARAAVNESFHAGCTLSVQDDNNVTAMKELLALLFDNKPTSKADLLLPRWNIVVYDRTIILIIIN